MTQQQFACGCGVTERERDVLDLIGHGLSNAEIDAKPHLSESTVRTNVGRLVVKTGS